MSLRSNPLDKGLTKKQIFSSTLYIVFLSVSVWATGESISRSTDLPKVICYIMGLAAILGASVCLTLIKQSFSRGGHVSNRSSLFTIGIVGFLFLWLVSLTSNTHNFYYVSVINDLRQNELRVVRKQFELIQSNSLTSFELAKEEFRNEVESEITNMKYEIQNIGNPGRGNMTDSIIIRIEKLLEREVDDLDLPPISRIGRNLYADQLSNKIRDLLDDKLLSIEARINEMQNFLNKKKYQSIIIQVDETIDNSYNINVNEIKSILRNSYSYYSECYNYVVELFQSPFLQERTQLNLVKLDDVPESIQLENIARSWENFLSGKFESLHFYLALIWALTIDVACFILFYFGVLPKED